MRTSRVFQPTNDEIDAFVRDHPLALVVSSSPQGLLATPLPLLLDRTENAVSLLGHFARSNPHVDAVRSQPEALIAFMGPEGYVSPSWFTDRTQAPTWNFATVHFNARIELHDDPQEARMAVERLTTTMEADRSRRWQADELGERYALLIPAIIPFRAEVLGVTAKFKLGQNERPDVLVEAIQGATESGCEKLATMMKGANAQRL